MASGNIFKHFLWNHWANIELQLHMKTKDEGTKVCSNGPGHYQDGL